MPVRPTIVSDAQRVAIEKANPGKTPLPHIVWAIEIPQSWIKHLDKDLHKEHITNYPAKTYNLKPR